MSSRVAFRCAILPDANLTSLRNSAPRTLRRNQQEAAFGAWSDQKFAPEEDFLKKIKAIPGVSVVETQTYTIMPM